MKKAFFITLALIIVGLGGCNLQTPFSRSVQNSRFENNSDEACLSGAEPCNSPSYHGQMGGMMGHNMGNRGFGLMMNGSDNGEKFADSTVNLPEVEPTKIVTLQDGDSFQMTAEIVQQEVGNRTIRRLAYNRQIPGPLLEVEKNATITLILTNHLPLPTTLHSHGVRVDDDFDGVPFDMGGNQAPIKPGESFSYTLTFPDTGVYWYHPHIREDYTQEMGLYGNFHVTEENYWNPVNREEFLILDDFSENDPFYTDVTNKTLMGRYGNLLLVNNQEDFRLEVEQGERIRFFTTNTANTRTFDFAIPGQTLQIVGGDLGRIEKEFVTDHFVIAPAERVIFEVSFDEPGTFAIEHRGQKIGEILVAENPVSSPDTKVLVLRENPIDYAVIRENFEQLLRQPIDKKLRLTIGMKGMSDEMGMMGGGMTNMGSVSGATHSDEAGIEWEDNMPPMNAMSTDQMVEWRIIDETDPQNPKTNVEMNENWVFAKDELVKIEIFNDPTSMHPMQHPIHFHGQRFVVLTRDGIPNENLQWKDTVLIRDGETIQILLETSNPGKWIAHCHIAEHMHAGMMFNFRVQ